MRYIVRVRNGKWAVVDSEIGETVGEYRYIAQATDAARVLNLRTDKVRY